MNAATVCSQQQSNALAMVGAASKYNKSVLVSEFGQFDCYCPTATGFQSAGVGWIGWELMLEHDQFSTFQGLVYKNGTFRDEAEAECLKSLSTVSADTLSCPSSPSRPIYPGPDNCIANGCTIFSNVNTTFLTYHPPSTNVQESCWTSWVGSGPTETRGTLHYCNTGGANISFVIPRSAIGVDLVYKSGPDCGIMSISRLTSQVIPQEIDTYNATVNWESTSRIATYVPAGEKFVITVAPHRNHQSSNSWIQLVSVNVFWN